MIDRANAGDPNHVWVRGERRPKELAHSDLLTEWVHRLIPDPSEELLLAARAHHIRRWEVPRDSYPSSRQGYLRWRTGLHEFHARVTGEIMEQAGYGPDVIKRVKEIIRKQRLKRDPEVQALEDGLCLVFLETQLDDEYERIDDDKMVEILRKTWGKMSPAGQRAAVQLSLSARGRALVERALDAGS